MKVIQFDKSKYGKELLMDLGKFEETPQFFFEETPHTADFYEIFFFRKAKGTLQLDDQIIPLRNSLIVFASPYQRRSWKVDRAEIEGYFLIFASQFLELFFTDPLFIFRLQFFHNHQSPLYLEESEVGFYHHTHAFLAMTHELQHLQSDSEDFLRSFLLLLLAGTNRAYCHAHQLSPERRNHQEAYQFKKLVEEQIRSLQRVEEYAQKLQISRVTLNKMVKAHFGITAAQFIKRRLLTEIKRELLFTSKPIAEIAYHLSFSESSSMIRFFNKLEAVSPSEYRSAYQNVN